MLRWNVIVARLLLASALSVAWAMVATARPSDWRAWSNSGNALAALERWADAAQALRRAVNLNPGENAIRRNLATALAQEGDVSIPEPPRLQMNMQPVGQSLSQLLDAGYRVIDFSLVEGSEALFVVMRNGHHVMCFVERDGYSQCMALH